MKLSPKGLGGKGGCWSEDATMAREQGFSGNHSRRSVLSPTTNAKGLDGKNGCWSEDAITAREHGFSGNHSRRSVLV